LPCHRRGSSPSSWRQPGGCPCWRSSDCAPRPRRALVAAALAVVDLALLARLDTGISVAIAGCGLLAALAAAAQDALFTRPGRRHPRSFRTLPAVRHRQAIAVLSLAALIVVWALRGLLDPAPTSGCRSESPPAAMHALVAAAALFGAAAALLWTRRQPRRAAVWASLAAVLLLLWAARGPLIDTLLDRRGESAARVAAIVDPAYALLADDRAFAKGSPRGARPPRPRPTSPAGRGSSAPRCSTPASSSPSRTTTCRC
jgi:hypothetical protein